MILFGHSRKQQTTSKMDQRGLETKTAATQIIRTYICYILKTSNAGLNEIRRRHTLHSYINHTKTPYAGGLFTSTNGQLSRATSLPTTPKPQFLNKSTIIQFRGVHAENVDALVYSSSRHTNPNLGGGFSAQLPQRTYCTHREPVSQPARVPPRYP